MIDDQSDGSTRVDLGDDLIERTATSIHRPLSETPPPLPTSSNPQSDFESAKILANEGMTEEAKKILRRLLIANPSYVAAKDLLSQIHEKELKEIFSDNDSARRFAIRALPSEPEPKPGDATQIIQTLEKDYDLEFSQTEPSLDLRPSLFRSPEAIEMLDKGLNEELKDLSPQDRIDLGIGFLEMTLYTLAQKQFEAALRGFSESEDQISATSLLAYTFILARKPFEAISVLQPILTDPCIKADEKIEIFYLMGRANEQLSRFEVATEWYQQVFKVDPFYRDIQERLRRR